MSKNKGKDIELTNRNDIADFILQEFVINNEDENQSVKDVLDNIPLLEENGLAYVNSNYCIFGYDRMYINQAKFIVACKMMHKYNKSLKNFRKDIDNDEFGGSETNYSNINKKLVESVKYTLSTGTYLAKIDENNYLVLDIKNGVDKDDFDIKYTFSIIGKNFKKYKKKYLHKCDKMLKLVDTQEDECIFKNGSLTNTVFKPFDQFIYKDKDKLIKYIDNWIKNIPIYYNKYNMISKLSILLYGKPGNGKTTLSKTIAKYLKIKLVEEINSDYFTENRPKSGRSRHSARYSEPRVFAIDDIDTLCNSREKDTSKENLEKIQMLLSFLDNPPSFYYKASDGIKYPVSIVIATTNYIDRLDDAVKRYGRFDLKIEMPEFDKEDAQAMCNLYELKLEDLFPNCSDDNFNVTPAQLQAICMENVDNKIKNK